MAKPEILEKTPVSLTEIKAELTASQKKEEQPIGFRATKTLEYLNSLQLPSKAAYAEMKKKIEDLSVPRLKEEHVVKILDTVPKTVAELQVVLQGYNVTISKENQQSIVNVVIENAK